MQTTVVLPMADGSLVTYATGPPGEWRRPEAPIRCRVPLAAAHVVADVLAVTEDAPGAALDWDATLAYRRHLWSWGLGVAEAMDTAQRGMGLDWPAAQELIARSIKEASAADGVLVCGVNTDQLLPGAPTTLADVVAAYVEQCEFVESRGGNVVLMASRHLAACARHADDYAHVYGRVLEQVSRPVIIHWLGGMFDPALASYWGSADLDAATDVLLAIISAHAEKVDGTKISLLDGAREIGLRRRLPPGVRLYSGDDFNFPTMLKGDEHGHSDALLGVFDAIAPAASSALQALDAGDEKAYDDALARTLPLSRHIFRSPTYNYKTGIVLLAYLNGHQDHFRMVGGMESARSAIHLAELFVLADKAGLLDDPPLAAARMRRVLAVAGVD